MQAKDLLKMKIRWMERRPASWEAEINGVLCTLEMNDFPDEPMYTVRVGNSHVDLDDRPTCWTLEGLA